MTRQDNIAERVALEDFTNGIQFSAELNIDLCIIKTKLDTVQLETNNLFPGFSRNDKSLFKGKDRTREDLGSLYHVFKRMNPGSFVNRGNSLHKLHFDLFISRADHLEINIMFAGNFSRQRQRAVSSPFITMSSISK